MLPSSLRRSIRSLSKNKLNSGRLARTTSITEGCSVDLRSERRHKSSLSSSQIEHSSSLQDPIAFWNKHAKKIEWFRWNGAKQDGTGISFDGDLNISYNCVDSHVNAGRGDQTAIIWDSAVSIPSIIKKLTYKDLLSQVECCTTLLKKNMGISQGDRVIIYMPNSMEAVIVMLSCARIGAIHSVVFGGFAPHELATRIKDCQPKAIILSSCGIDGKKVIPYFPLVEQALAISECTTVRNCLIHQRSEHMQSFNDITMQAKVLEWDAEMQGIRNSMSSEDISSCAKPAAMKSSDPLYILYTSGTTGNPKGVVRDTGGYATGLAYSMEYVYGVKEPGAVFWAASDIGWIVGHSYSVYGPLLSGATTVLYEGKPVHTPDESQFWRVCERHKVNVLFTAPTALRAIKKLDDHGVLAKQFDLSSLRHVFLAGEHADENTVKWTERSTQKSVLDHWWQTETGGLLLFNDAPVDLPILTFFTLYSHSRLANLLQLARLQ